MKKIFVVVETVMEDGITENYFSKAFQDEENALKEFKSIRDNAYNSIFNYYSKDEVNEYTDTKTEFEVSVFDDVFSHSVYIKELEVAD